LTVAFIGQRRRGVREKRCKWGELLIARKKEQCIDGCEKHLIVLAWAVRPTASSERLPGIAWRAVQSSNCK
jgi:hypothetical protein